MEKEEKKLDLFEFSWGKFGAAMGVLGLIGMLFDLESLFLIAKMFLYTVVVPVIGIFAFLMCTWSPTRAIFWTIFNSLIDKMNEEKERLWEKANREEQEQEEDEEKEAV